MLGTPLALTTYADLVAWCFSRPAEAPPVAIEFANTHVVTQRRHDPAFRELTEGYDYFIPDATPLTWCLNWQGARLPDRVYGPAFMRECFARAPGNLRHYLLGGSEQCGARLRTVFRELNPAVQFVGAWHGRCSPEGVLEGAADTQVLEELDRLSPDLIWVGFGTPKQQAWVRRHKHQLRRGIVLTVGFAFDVNAGTKPDAPPWMQRLGLTWLFRMASEPRRLVGRYFKYNSLFLGYLIWDALRGGAKRGQGSPPASGSR